MAQKELRTVITIGGRTDNSFNRLGNRLTELGSVLDALGGKTFEFAQESVKAYADYDDTLRSIQGKFGDATESEMAQLDRTMREWAETTRYHATEVSKAVESAATSGWKLMDVYEGIPQVMDLAAAADMDMAEAMEYLNSALAGQGMSLEDSQELIDQWGKTANNSRASVEDLGESFETMGSLMTFTESSEELLTLLAMMAEYGTKGSEAGTLLRNVILRMVAPTDKAAAALQLLNASEEEMLELENADLGNAAARMEELGLSAFDANGNLRGVIDIVNDLREAVSGMTEQEMYDVLYDIFPTRTIRGIMDLMRASETQYASMMRTITDSDGYARWVAELREGGIGGEMRTLESRAEEFSLRFGEALAPDTQQWAGIAGNALGAINDLPDEAWAFLAKGATTFGAAGSVLVTLGTAARVIGMLANPVSLTAAGIVAAAAGIDAFVDIYNISRLEALNENFGEMQLQTEMLEEHLYDLGGGFRSTYGALDVYQSALTAAVDSYKSASGELSSNLLSFAISGTTLTDADKERLYALSGEMHDALIAGIDQSAAGSMTYWQMLFGGAGAAENNGDYNSLIAVLGNEYDRSIAEANAISEEFRSALTSAFADGEITSDEYAQLVAYFKAYNEAMERAAAEAEDYDRQVEMGKLLEKSQTASLSQLKEYAGQAVTQRDAELTAMEDRDLTEYVKAKMAFEDEVAAGRMTQAEMDRRLSALRSRQEGGRADKRAEYDRYIDNIWRSGLAGSGLQDDLQKLEGLTQQYFAGNIGMAELYDEMAGYSGRKDMGALRDYMAMWMGSLDEGGANYQRVHSMNSLLHGMAPVYTGESGRTGMVIPVGFDVDVPDGSGEASRFATDFQAQLDVNPAYYHVQVRAMGSPVGQVSGRSSMSMFAEGGRAETASIFGEAGPEWAIPEAHTARTAALLNAARQASGFGWSELIAASGGNQSVTRQLIYSPTIVANDASGVDAALRNDKSRLEKWLRDMDMRRDVEVYA